MFPPLIMFLGNLKFRLLDFRKPRLQIHLAWCPGPSILPVNDTMYDVQDDEDGDTDVGGEEGGGGELTVKEDGEAVDEEKKGEHDEGDVGTVGLEAGVEWWRDALSEAGFAESKVDDAAADPGDEAGGVGEVDEPGEDG